jgi:hypothetical protein
MSESLDFDDGLLPEPEDLDSLPDDLGTDFADPELEIDD